MCLRRSSCEMRVSSIRYKSPESTRLARGRMAAGLKRMRAGSGEGLGFRPLYRQAKDVLTRRIAEGAWQPGQILPSEFEIAADLGVSQGTVRKALDEMTAENLLVRRQGRGTFVARHDDARILFQFFKLVPDSGERSFPESRVLEVTKTTDPQATEMLRLRPRDPVLQ